MGLFFTNQQSNKPDLLSVFTRLTTNNFDVMKIYGLYYSCIPNVIIEEKMDCEKAHSWFIQNYGQIIKNKFWIKRNFERKKIARFDDTFHLVFKDTLIQFDRNAEEIIILFHETNSEIIDNLHKSISRFKKRKKLSNPEISILINENNYGLSLKTVNISRYRLNVSENYNDDFLEVHQTIQNRLRKKNDKGIVLLHGKPGTGKTSYMRYLISTLKKDVIFLPPNLAGAITNPNLISVLVKNPNSVFVIEDAENIVVDRSVDNESPVSAILNIADGLLSDCLNIQIICSFNTNLDKVDKALLRKGRLIARYDFNELSIEKAQALSDKLGFKTKISEPMTLTSIYNQKESEYHQIKNHNPIGFRAISEN